MENRNVKRMTAITVTTGIPVARRNPEPRSTSRRLPTTTPGRRPSVATGRSLGAGSAVPGPAVARFTRRPVSPAVYWRRRLLVAALVFGLVVGLVLVMAQAGAALGGSSLATPERRPAAQASAADASLRQVVVRPGDSLWSVATRLAPGSDPRPVVDALVAARHGAPLVPGETIEWAR
jgi:hypothetical protein